jgi:hypothetical protein
MAPAAIAAPFKRPRLRGLLLSVMTCLLLLKNDKSTHHSALPIPYKEGFHQRAKMITPLITSYPGETVFASQAGIEKTFK